MSATIQDLEKAAEDLGAAIDAFADADQVAHDDNAAAQAAVAQATASEAESAAAKDEMIAVHEAFDKVLADYLASNGRTPPTAPKK